MSVTERTSFSSCAQRWLVTLRAEREEACVLLVFLLSFLSQDKWTGGEEIWVESKSVTLHFGRHSALRNFSPSITNPGETGVYSVKLPRSWAWRSRFAADVPTVSPDCWHARVCRAVCWLWKTRSGRELKQAFRCLQLQAAAFGVWLRVSALLQTTPLRGRSPNELHIACPERAEPG